MIAPVTFARACSHATSGIHDDRQRAMCPQACDVAVSRSAHREVTRQVPRADNGAPF